MIEVPSDAKYVMRYLKRSRQWLPPQNEFVHVTYRRFTQAFNWDASHVRFFEYNGKVYVVSKDPHRVKVYPDLETAKIAVELQT